MFNNWANVGSLKHYLKYYCTFPTFQYCQFSRIKGAYGVYYFDLVFPLQCFYLTNQPLQIMYYLKDPLMKIRNASQEVPFKQGLKFGGIKERSKHSAQCFQTELLSTIIYQGPSNFTNVGKRSIRRFS